MKRAAELGRMARRLWPEDRMLRLTWLRAVRRVRQTSRGWIVERHVSRQEAA